MAAMCDDGISESLIEKLTAYSQMPYDNLESFRSVTAKLHSRTSSQDKLVKEQTLECITDAKTGIVDLLLKLLQNLEDDTAICSVAGILRECVAPSAGKSRRKAISQLVAMNASQILVGIIMQQQNVSETLLLEEMWLLAQVAQRDAKFSIKIKLLGVTKVFHSLLRAHYTNVKLLSPILIVIKCLTKNASTTSILVKDGIFSSFEKTLIFIGYTPNMKLKLVLGITNQLTKSRLCCIRMVKSGLLPLLLRTFECWERYDGKSRLKICNYIIITVQHLCSTKIGRQYIRKQNVISSLHKFGTSCPEDRSYDSLLSRVCHIINTCMEKRQLPIECLPSPATFNIPKLKTLDIKASASLTSNEVVTDSGEDDSDDDDDYYDDEDSDDFGNEDDDDDDDDEEENCRKKRKHKYYKLEMPVKRSIEDLAGYAKCFQEFENNEKKKKKETNPWCPIIIPVKTESLYRKVSCDEMYSKKHSSDTNIESINEIGYTNRCMTDKHSLIKDLTSIADIHEDSGFRHAYSRIASRVNSVLPFVKIAYPDMMVGESVAFPEPLNVKDRKVCRTKMLACIEYGVKKLESPNSKIVFDLDSLITEFPQTQQVDDKERIVARGCYRLLKFPQKCTRKDNVSRLLFNIDEAHLGQKQVYKPHLCFESRFESGNLRKVIQVGEVEYDLILMPDVNSSRHHQWFYFQVYNMEQGIPYTFNIINCEKQNSQFNYGMKPLMYSVQDAVMGRPGWMRVGTDICYYRNCYRNPTERKQQSYLTMTFTLTFPHSYDVCYIAYHYPYTYSQLLAQIWKWSLTADPSIIYFRAESLCLSLNNNETPLLTITATESDAAPISTRSIVFLTSRVHPGESNSSWVMHGTISYLLSDSPSAVLLRNKFVFKIVPMLNMEGVINGCHRCGLTNEDLNRCWSRPNQYLHPIIYHTKGLLEYSVQILKKTPILFCDYHGHSRRKNVFFYGCSNADSWCEADRESSENPADYLILPHMVSNLSPAFSLQQCSFRVEYGRESTARVTVWREFGVKCSYTMESSYCGFDQGQYEGFHLNTYHLREIGQHFCDGLACLNDSSYWKTGCAAALSLSGMLETSGSEDKSECSDCEDEDNPSSKEMF